MYFSRCDLEKAICSGVGFHPRESVCVVLYEVAFVWVSNQVGFECVLNQSAYVLDQVVYG